MTTVKPATATQRAHWLAHANFPSQPHGSILREVVLSYEAALVQAEAARDTCRHQNDLLTTSNAALNEQCTALEQALETIDKHNRHHEDHMGCADSYTRAIRIAVVGALHPECANPHIGTTLDACLESDGIKGEVDEIAAMRVALANVSGALCDSGVVVPDDPTRYGEAVREIMKERDAARAELEKLRALNKQNADVHARCEEHERTLRFSAEHERDAAQAELARVQANATANDALWRHRYDAAQADAAAWKELHDRHCGAACCEGLPR